MTNANPTGVDFIDRVTGRYARLVTEPGETFGWLLFKHPDGQWVTWRRATAKDLLQFPPDVRDVFLKHGADVVTGGDADAE